MPYEFSESGCGMKFKLRTVFLLFILAALLSLGLRYRIVHRPLKFQAYSAQQLQESLAKGRVVLVSIGADWSANSAVQTKIIADDLGYSVRRKGVVALKADWTKQTPEVQSLMADLGVKSVPAVAIFYPSKAKKPVLVTDLDPRTRILEEIE